MSDTLRLKHGVRAPGHARRWIVQQCHEWQCAELADTAAVLITELVTNVFLHARSDCLIQAGFDPPILAVTVSDEDESEFSLPSPTDTAEGGRGLAIVAALADTWGIRQSDRGKSVWFQLSTTTRPNA